MPWGASIGRARDLLEAAFLRMGRLRRAERATRAEVLEIQRLRLGHILEHAALRSPFYRKRWGGRVPRPEELRALEPVEKAELLVRRFDDALTDRSLSREGLRRFLGSTERHPYVVVATSGTTGEPAIMPWARREWVEGLAFAMRGQSRYAGPGDIFRAARRMAAVTTHNPIHASSQLALSFDFSPWPQLRLAAGSPLADQVARLNRYRPALLSGYPSAIDALAREQLEGRVRIRPRFVLTGGEAVTRAFRERVRAAWCIEVFDCYGLTEALLVGWECREHRGLHVDEDAVALEVVDGAGRVLPPGEEGSAVLLTHLYNHTLPVIRYRVGDAMTISDEPCPCGLPFARITSIAGRKEEILSLPNTRGGTTEVHAFVIETPLEACPDVLRFQIRAHENGAVVRVVPRDGSEGLAARLEPAIVSVLAPHGVRPGAVRVEVVADLSGERGATDKRRRVVK